MVPHGRKVVLKCIIVDSGELYAMTVPTITLLLLSVGNLDTLRKLSFIADSLPLSMRLQQTTN